ncbi:fungal specific transcription factor domain-containing protein [Trichoderma breve]|uniref:Fungal specific transcription factor domain-containing protein n=1 Tax=Trichoderma breve TaxID=2034170 RepID=A0A9W9EAY0_9HYPO|nr:fungal specific transcription factor domain-containing protein [Trichoderma breve]KAJ4863329.1 fungal specific transcription factor domain-containing protein [Trichoderma breve]
MKDSTEVAVSSRRGGRRKACDLCCQKKIRCNGAKPRCSHCQIYESECVYNGVQRKTVPRVNSAPRVESLEARMGRMELILEGLKTQIDILSKRGEIESAVEDVQEVFPSSEEREDERTLPPLSDILPIVDEYFSSTNRLLPLFDQIKFMQMLRGWYSNPDQRGSATWAAINVVLALGLLLQPHINAGGDLTVATLVKNAQSVLDEIVTREEDILSAQIVLGLCILFQESPDPQPASVLVATAITLVHRLRLYSRSGQENLSQADIRQRDRLFWIAYILDKSISLRAQQPPLLSDAWTDIDLPEADPIDGAGVVYSLQGTSKINFFRLRVQLGIIQGKVYEWLYSVTADKLLSAAKEQFVQSVECTLHQWEESLPREFMPDSILESAPLGTVQHLASLHWTYLHTSALIHRAHSHNQKWIQIILQRSAIIIDEPIRCAITSPQPSLPGSWSKLVSSSRACMKLWDSMLTYNEPLIWSTLCGRITGLLLLLVNNLTEPQHEMLIADQRLVEAAIQSLVPIAAKLRNRQFQQVYHACEELALKVRILIERSINVVSASEAQYFLAEVQLGSSLDEPGTQPVLGLVQGLYHGGKRPEVMPTNPLGEAILQEDGSPLVDNSAISGTALFSWN